MFAVYLRDEFDICGNLSKCVYKRILGMSAGTLDAKNARFLYFMTTTASLLLGRFPPDVL